MPKVLIKETITKEIEIPLETIYNLIDALPVEEKKDLLNKLLVSMEKREGIEFIPFKKERIEDIIADFKAIDLYEEDFLRDLEEGIKKSSVYR